MVTQNVWTGKKWLRLILILPALLVVVLGASAQTTQFTYQGKLADGGNPANGQYDFKFKLYDTATVGTGTQQGGDVAVSNVTVTAGIFTAQLDFGVCASCFNGSARFLEIAVKQTSGSTFTTLGPRQPVTSDPYAIRSLNSTTADGLSVACVGCITSSQIGGVSGSVVSGTIPVASVPAGSGNYLQNGASPQAMANFNISGDGTAGGTLSGNAVNATTQFNLGGSRIFSAAGTNNLFAGANAGANNTTGTANAFFGQNAGQSNTTGSSNEFFGYNAGNHTTTGGNNVFFGDAAGFFNTTGSRNSFAGFLAGFHSTADDNSFFGFQAGVNNTTGFNNSFFGRDAGQGNTTACCNAFFGYAAGFSNTTGFTNSFFGGHAGLSNTVGTANSFFGYQAGDSNTAGYYNSFFGTFAGLFNTTGGYNSFFGQEAGRSNTTASYNSFFGFDAGYNNTTGERNSFFGTSAGQSNTTGTVNSFFGMWAGQINTTGTFNSFFGTYAGLSNTTSDSNSFFGAYAGSNTTGGSNSFFGKSAGATNTTGSNNTLVGESADVGVNNLSNAAAIGYRAQVTQSNSMVLGSINGVNSATADTNVGIGTTAPNARLHIAVNAGNILLGDAGCSSGSTGLGFGSSLSGCTNYSLRGDGADTNINRPTGGAIYFRENNTAQVVIEPGGIVALNTLGAAGSQGLCRNALKEISACSSSLRYKERLAPFTSGLDLIKKLRPITFNWKQSGERDLGLAAEDVAEIEPLLVTYNDKGQVEGVKYDRITVALINAIREQQAQIKGAERQAAIQQVRIDHQQKEIEALKRVLCSIGPKANTRKSQHQAMRETRMSRTYRGGR